MADYYGFDITITPKLEIPEAFILQKDNIATSEKLEYDNNSAASIIINDKVIHNKKRKINSNEIINDETNANSNNSIDNTQKSKVSLRPLLNNSWYDSSSTKVAVVANILTTTNKSTSKKPKSDNSNSNSSSNTCSNTNTPRVPIKSNVNKIATPTVPNNKPIASNNTLLLRRAFKSILPFTKNNISH